MARRSKDWNEGLAEDLQDPEFARQFLTAAVEDGIPLKIALAKVIRAKGVKEFAEVVGMPLDRDRVQRPHEMGLNRNRHHRQ